jgi:hypothetical protein
MIKAIFSTYLEYFKKPKNNKIAVMLRYQWNAACTGSWITYISLTDVEVQGGQSPLEGFAHTSQNLVTHDILQHSILHASPLTNIALFCILITAVCAIAY